MKMTFIKVVIIGVVADILFLISIDIVLLLI